MSTHAAGDLTSSEYWDAAWQDAGGPRPVVKGRRLYIDAITDLFDRFVPRGPSVKTVELGGAPGPFLVYFNRTYGHRVALVDYSPVGCEQARARFAGLGLDAEVHVGDIFDHAQGIGQFDVVYSLGLIEHFDDLDAVFRAHVRFVRPGGLLLVGCPNYRGVNGVLKRWLQPHSYSVHNVATMDTATWRPIEHRLGLERLSVGYIGGFEPLLFKQTERHGLIPRLAARVFLLVGGALNLSPARILRRLNHPWVSNYVMGVYRVAAADPGETAPV
jgi:SAM-dependent methyltransferase